MSGQAEISIRATCESQDLAKLLTYLHLGGYVTIEIPQVDRTQKKYIIQYHSMFRGNKQ